MIEGSQLAALIVGGGPVAARKAEALLAAGAQVRLVAPKIGAAVRTLADQYSALALYERGYLSGDVGDASLVFAATDQPAVNTRIAEDARLAGRLVNVTDAPSASSFTTPAAHRAGGVVVAVSAAGVPRAATRIRDAIGRQVDERYATALQSLARLRRDLLQRGERAQWQAAMQALIGDDFCDAVEEGAFERRVSAWR